MCNSNRDEKLSELMDEFGLEGYGFYWLVIELIGEQLNEKNKTYLSYSPNKWKRISGVSSQKLRVLLEFLKNRELFLIENTKVLITIDCPNLLKFRDEYTERASKSRDKVGTKSGQKPEQDTELDTELDTKTERAFKKTLSSSTKLDHDRPVDNSLELTPKKPKIKYLDQAEEILNFMNNLLNRNFKARNPNGQPTANADMVIKLFKAGYTTMNIKQATARKFHDWSDDPKMERYLRPLTLFQKSKFETYLAECVPPKEEKSEPIFEDFPDDLFDENLDEKS